MLLLLNGVCYCCCYYWVEFVVVKDLLWISFIRNSPVGVLIIGSNWRAAPLFFIWKSCSSYIWLNQHLTSISVDCFETMSLGTNGQKCDYPPTKRLPRNPSVKYWWYWYLFLAFLRVVFIFIPQTGYVHPDEFFQTTEIINGMIKSIFYSLRTNWIFLQLIYRWSLSIGTRTCLGI